MVAVAFEAGVPGPARTMALAAAVDAAQAQVLGRPGGLDRPGLAARGAGMTARAALAASQVRAMVERGPPQHRLGGLDGLERAQLRDLVAVAAAGRQTRDGLQ